jgi:hypothetical protein
MAVGCVVELLHRAQLRILSAKSSP